MLGSDQTAMRALVLASTIALCAGCTSDNNAPAQHAANDDHVFQHQRHDPFAHPRSNEEFEHPVAIAVSVSAPPPISIFGDLPNTAALSLPPSRSLDQTQNIRQVTFASEGADFDPNPSRDAKRIYFASTRHRPTADIYVQNVDGAAVTQLTSDLSHDVMPAISPDDQRVAFASNRHGSWDIFMMGSEGGQAVQVTSDAANELHPSWSPDGSMLVYCRLAESSERWEIWVTDTSKPSSHTFLTYGLFPEWHPTQDKILFQRSRDRGDRFFSLWTIDYVNGEATSPTEVISSASAAVINPSWSPDGRFIACATVSQPRSTLARPAPPVLPSIADVWIISADGRARTNLTAGFRFNSMPAWASNNHIFFVSDRAGPTAIWSLQPAQAINVARLEQPGFDPAIADAQDNDTED